MAELRSLSASPIRADNLPQSDDELVQTSNTNFDNDGHLIMDVNYAPQVDEVISMADKLARMYKPKQPPSCDLLYYASVRETKEFKELNLGATEQLKKLAKQWKELKLDEQQKWKVKAEPARDEWKVQMADWKKLSAEKRYEITDLALDGKKLYNGSGNMFETRKTIFTCCFFVFVFFETTDLIIIVRLIFRICQKKSLSKSGTTSLGKFLFYHHLIQLINSSILSGTITYEQIKQEADEYWGKLWNTNLVDQDFQEEQLKFEAVLEDVCEPNAAGKLYKLVTAPNEQIELASIPNNCNKYTGESFNEKNNRESEHFASFHVMKKSYDDEDKKFTGLKECYSTETKLYAWIALVNIKPAYILDFEHCSMLADMSLSDDVWNKKVEGLTSDKFKDFHPQKAIKFGLFLNKKLAIKLKAGHDSGELLKCAEFIDAVSKWPAKTHKKYLNAIGFNTNEIDDVNTPDEPSREEQLLRQIEELKRQNAEKDVKIGKKDAEIADQAKIISEYKPNSKYKSKANCFSSQKCCL